MTFDIRNNLETEKTLSCYTECKHDERGSFCDIHRLEMRIFNP